MKNGELDDVDREILYYLQQDARHTSSSDIAGKLDMSASTVRTRLKELEDSGVIRGYHLDIDYDLAGYPLYAKIICTAAIADRDRLANAAREVDGVTAVRELMTGEGNVHVNAIGTDRDDLSRITETLDSKGLEIVDEKLIRDEHVCPYHGFLDTKSRGEPVDDEPE